MCVMAYESITLVTDQRAQKVRMPKQRVRIRAMNMEVSNL